MNRNRRFFFFFFSSRRRHTRWNCDWGSDVCSSDLKRLAAPKKGSRTQRELFFRPSPIRGQREGLDARDETDKAERQPQQTGTSRNKDDDVRRPHVHEIGRASCRERVAIWARDATSE